MDYRPGRITSSRCIFDSFPGLISLLLIVVFVAPGFSQSSAEDREKKLLEIQRKLREESKRAKSNTPEPDLIKSTRGSKTKAEKSTYFLEVPIIGPIGPSLEHGSGNSAVTLDRALAYAVSQNIKHVIFHIDSPGGRVSEADAMVAVMDRYADRLTYHTVIKRAISAAIWIVFNSDSIYVMDKGVVGGAVPYRQDQVGNIQVSEKMNSIIAAKVAASAEAKGHSSVLVKSMILMGHSAYKWKNRSGKIQITSTRPSAGASEGEELDNEKTVRTLTSKEAERVGFAHVESSQDIGSLIKADKWRRANFYGYVIVLYDQAFRNQTIKEAVEVNFQRLSPQQITTSGPTQPGYFQDPESGVIIPFIGYKGTRETFVKQIKRLKSQLTPRFASVIKRIEETDPERDLRVYDASTGQLSAQFVANWQTHRRSCISAWRTLKGAQTAGSRYFEKCGPLIGDDYPPQAIVEIWERSEEFFKTSDGKK